MKTRIKNSELLPRHSSFGNKGSLWADMAHIAEYGSPTTLCGVPMLSHNYCKDSDIGCTKCIQIHEAKIETVGDSKKI